MARFTTTVLVKVVLTHSDDTPPDYNDAVLDEATRFAREGVEAMGYVVTESARTKTIRLDG
jgi:hypothetical protein